MNTWQEWLQERRAASNMKVTEIPLQAAAPWCVMNVKNVAGGIPHHVGREDGKFFTVNAIRVGEANREVEGWPQVVIKEAAKPGEEGVVVLVCDVQGNCLVQAKAEPGNDTPGCVLLAPTLQVSRANLGQAHGGKRPWRAELVGDEALDGAILIHADGARFLGKHASFIVITVEASTIECA